jgi:hypothetical protein
MSDMIEVSKKQLLVTRIAAAVLAVALVVLLFKLLNPPLPVQTDGPAIVDKEPIRIPKTLEEELRKRDFVLLMAVNTQSRIMAVAIDGTPLESCGQLDGIVVPDSCGRKTRDYASSNQVTISTFTGSRYGDLSIFGTLFRDVHFDGPHRGKQPCHPHHPPRRPR